MNLYTCVLVRSNTNQTNQFFFPQNSIENQSKDRLVALTNIQALLTATKVKVTNKEDTKNFLVCYRLFFLLYIMVVT